MSPILSRVREESFAVRRLARRTGRMTPSPVAAVPERPLGVKLEMTYACNLRCGFCYTDSPRHTVARTPEMSDEDYREVCRQIIDLGVIEAVVTGGEPFLRRELTLDTVGRLTAAGVGVTLNTNGWFVDDAVADRLAAMRGLHAHVSVDGATPAAHDASRGMPGSWRRAIAALDRLLERGVPVVVVHVLTPDNEDELDDFLEQMWVLGVPLVRVTPVLPLGNAARTGGAEWGVDRDRMRRTVDSFAERRGGAMRVIAQAGTGQQIAVREDLPPGSMLVRPDGRVRLDSVHPFAFGHALEDGLEHCWQRIREEWDAPRIAEWADSIGSTTGFSDADVVPYLDDEVEIDAPAPTREERRTVMELPVAPRVPVAADGEEQLEDCQAKVRGMALARPYRVGPVRMAGGSVERFVRRTDTGRVTRLNATAAAVMDALDGGAPADAVAALSLAHPAVKPSTIEDDVLAVIRTLVGQGVVFPAAAAGPALPAVESTSDLPGSRPGETA
jgi:MoaA/NifB/PqqE/SkfB family radical SAM enzyme